MRTPLAAGIIRAGALTATGRNGKSPSSQFSHTVQWTMYMSTLRIDVKAKEPGPPLQWECNGLGMFDKKAAKLLSVPIDRGTRWARIANITRLRFVIPLPRTLFTP